MTFMMGIFAADPGTSHIDMIHPNLDPTERSAVTGGVLLKLADAINERLHIRACSLKDVAGRTFCARTTDTWYSVPLGVLFLLANGRSWYMQHGYRYPKTARWGLQLLACLRQKPASEVFLPGHPLESLATMGATVADAVRTLTVDLYSQDPRYCHLLEHLSERLSRLEAYLHLNGQIVTKVYHATSGTLSVPPEISCRQHVSQQTIDHMRNILNL
jgi:hypothetical protein